MRCSISGLITTLLFTMVTLPVVAQTPMPATAASPNPTVAMPSVANQLSPFNLAYLAYQGYLAEQGIPGTGALIEAIAARSITAPDIMQAAVNAALLSAPTLNDQRYRHDLETQLNELTAD